MWRSFLIALEMALDLHIPLDWYLRYRPGALNHHINSLFSSSERLSDFPWVTANPNVVNRRWTVVGLLQIMSVNNLYKTRKATMHTSSWFHAFLVCDWCPFVPYPHSDSPKWARSLPCLKQRLYACVMKEVLMWFPAENSRQSLCWFFPVGFRLGSLRVGEVGNSLSVPDGDADMVSSLSCK